MSVETVEFQGETARYIYCNGVDDCEAWAPIEDTLSATRRRLRKQGWVLRKMSDGRLLDLCPECKGDSDEALREMWATTPGDPEGSEQP